MNVAFPAIVLVLVLALEMNHIIPFSDGKARFDAGPVLNKTFLKIPGDTEQTRSVAHHL